MPEFIKISKSEFVRVLTKAREIGEAEREALAQGATSMATKRAFRRFFPRILG